MEDQQTQQAVQSEPAVQPASDSPRPESTSSATPSIADTLREAANGQAPTVSEEVTPVNQEGGDDTDRKPTRYERRVENLIDKLKATSQQQPDMSQFLGNEPIFTQDEIQSGQFDPNAVQQRLLQREQLVQQRATQQALAAVQYQSSINDHLSDIDTVQKQLGDDPVLDKLVAKQYEALNHQIDPRTGMKVFVPTVKMSEIYQELKDAFDKKATAAAANVQIKVQQQANDQAVPVTVSQPTNQDLDQQAAFQKAASTGNAEDWAEVLKKRLKS